MNWQKNLRHVLGSYFCDSSTEEGAAELVFTTEDDPDYHHLCLSALDQGVGSATDGTPEEKAELVGILRRSNLAAATAEDVNNILKEIRSEYLRQYHLALTKLATTGDTK